MVFDYLDLDSNLFSGFTKCLTSSLNVFAYKMGIQSFISQTKTSLKIKIRVSFNTMGT